MKKFELSSAFLIGHEKIDADHAELIAILNGIVDGYLAKDTDYCREKWHEFCDKFKQHSQDEEAIMMEFGFDEDHHDGTHERVFNHINELGYKCETLRDWESCLYEMRNEVLSLILRHDLKFAEHLITIGYNHP